MQHITFGNSSFHTAILIKTSALNEQQMSDAYREPLRELGYDVSGLIGFSLTYDKKKPSAACRKDYLAQLLPALVQCKVKYLICADGEYFKTLTKNTKAEPHIGYVLPCAITGFEDLQVVYAQNYQGYFYNPDNKGKTQLSLEALVKHSQGTYEELGTNVLKDAHYPSTEGDIASWLDKLHDYSSLTCDIETTSLNFYEGIIYTIGFSWNKHSGVAFKVDANILNHLKNFFESYQGNLKFHNASFDISWLIYHLWMYGIISNQEGLLQGLEVMTRDFDCTKVISYLATNSCAGNHLSLKDQAHEFAGNYAQENIKDVTKIPMDDLLEYNLVDTCSTWFVYEKNSKVMKEDNQLEIYESLLKPALIDVIQMQLTGLPLNMPRTKEVNNILLGIRANAFDTVADQPLVKEFVRTEIEHEVTERNAAYKKKVIDASEAKFELNLNSTQQLTRLLYTTLGLPVIEHTDKGNPAVGASVLSKLINHTEDKQSILILENIIEFFAVDKLIGTFIKAFLEAPHDQQTDCHYLMGNFNIGGTVSGRLSSSQPVI
jgi:DNA polymerase-1